DKKENGLLMPDSADKAKSMKRVFYHCGSHANYSKAVGVKVANIERVYRADAKNDSQAAAVEARGKIAALQSEMRVSLSALGSAQIRLN
ncbi:hypothetical protein, partial [Pseudomonas sp. NPDC089734]|uniref:hypothetical protein n=1 Tax=Pseudomonas sp. NPDC089734 TaxID=3364469 RepID=UPI0037F9967F